MVKVLGLGDNVCDIYPNERTMYPGGQAVNFAVYAGMLGVKSDFMGVFGNDAIAGHVKASLDSLVNAMNGFKNFTFFSFNSSMLFLMFSE